MEGAEGYYLSSGYFIFQLQYEYFSYRYEMSNCLFEAAFEQILKDCKCAPGFHNEGGADAMEVSEAVSWQVVTLSDVTQHFQTYEVCTGAQLACSNEILNRMGQYNQGTVIEKN